MEGDRRQDTGDWTMGDAHILSFSGQLLGKVEALKLSESILALQEQGAVRLILDIPYVTLVNTPGVMFLAECHLRFKHAGGSFLVSNPTPQIQSVLRRMNLQALCK